MSPPEPPDDSVWARVSRALLRRPGRGQVAAAVLCGLLAFALVTQVHSNAAGRGLSSARPQDLLAILADVQGRADRLRTEVSDLQRVQASLTGGSASARAALAAAKARAQTLGILTGTLAAHGPGIVLTIADPRRSVRADVLVDAIEELRDAGAEAMQLGSVRVVASTAVVDDPRGGVDADGTPVTAPYRLIAIGDPNTLSTALTIPGGIVDTVAAQPGAHAAIASSANIEVTALRALQPPRYARPAPTRSP
jgi:uncharacterized protein YlxW (UPF0749 family)